MSSKKKGTLLERVLSTSPRVAKSPPTTSFKAPLAIPNQVSNAQNTNSASNRVPSAHEILLITKQIDDDLAEISRLQVDVEKRRGTVQVLQATLTRVKSVLNVLENMYQIAKIRMEMNISLNKYLIAVENIPSSTPPTSFNDFEAIIPEILNEYKQETKSIPSEKQYHTSKVRDISRRIKEIQDIKLASQAALTHAEKDEGNTTDHLARVKASLAQKRQLISSIRGMPTEVLIAIFKEVVYSQVDEMRQRLSTSTLPAAFVLSSVCNRWRMIVKGLPSLWEVIPLGNKARFQSSTSSPASLVYDRGIGTHRIIFHWPYESNSRYKSRVVDDSYSDSLSSEEESQPIGLVCPSERLFSSYKEGLSDRLENVRVAELIGRKRQDPLTVNCRIKAPSYYIWELIPTFPSDIAHQLRCLHLTLSTCPKSAELRAMLRVLTNLNTLRLEFAVFIVADLSVEDERVDLPALQYISTSPKLLDLLLRYYISAPALQRISLDTVDSSTKGVPGMSLDNLVNTDYPGQIQHFGLRGADSSKETASYLRPLMEKCTCITILELDYKDIAPIMEEIGRDVQLFPLLKRIVLHDARTSNESIGNVLDSRKNAEGCVSIDELVLDRCTGVKEDFCQELRGGVKVDVYC